MEGLHCYTGTRGELAGLDWIEITIKFIIKYLTLRSALDPLPGFVFLFRSSVGACFVKTISDLINLVPLCLRVSS